MPEHRRYASNAERQAAYRKRHRARTADRAAGEGGKITCGSWSKGNSPGSHPGNPGSIPGTGTNAIDEKAEQSVLPR